MEIPANRDEALEQIRTDFLLLASAELLHRQLVLPAHYDYENYNTVVRRDSPMSDIGELQIIEHGFRRYANGGHRLEAERSFQPGGVSGKVSSGAANALVWQALLAGNTGLTDREAAALLGAGTRGDVGAVRQVYTDLRRDGIAVRGDGDMRTRLNPYLVVMPIRVMEQPNRTVTRIPVLPLAQRWSDRTNLGRWERRRQQ